MVTLRLVVILLSCQKSDENLQIIKAYELPYKHEKKFLNNYNKYPISKGNRATCKKQNIWFKTGGDMTFSTDW